MRPHSFQFRMQIKYTYTYTYIQYKIFAKKGQRRVKQKLRDYDWLLRCHPQYTYLAIISAPYWLSNNLVSHNLKMFLLLMMMITTQHIQFINSFIRFHLMMKNLLFESVSSKPNAQCYKMAHARFILIRNVTCQSGSFALFRFCSNLRS